MSSGSSGTSGGAVFCRHLLGRAKTEAVIASRKINDGDLIRPLGTFSSQEKAWKIKNAAEISAAYFICQEIR